MLDRQRRLFTEFKTGGDSVEMRILMVMLLGVMACAGCSRSPSTDDLIGNLSSADELDRIKAVRLLPDHKGDATKVVPVLAELLKDRSVNVRRSAAIGLGNYGAEAKAAVPALEEAKNDKDAKVREAASVAISRIET
jgi:HEAT repeat protein